MLLRRPPSFPLFPYTTLFRSLSKAQPACFPNWSHKDQFRGFRFRMCVGQRSEEHTSELQSPCNLVCRLLLEKKKSCADSIACCCQSTSHRYTSELRLQRLSLQ